MVLPPQTTVVHHLEFSAQETEYYRRLEERCRAKARAGLTSGKFVDEIIKVRQACVHPSIGTHGIQAAGRDDTGPMDMAAVLKSMIKEARVESTTIARKVCRGRLVLASLMRAQGQHGVKPALEQYSTALVELQQMERDLRQHAAAKLHHDKKLATSTLSELRQADPSFSAQLVGRSVRKVAQDREFDGTVVRFQPGADGVDDLWSVRYEDAAAAAEEDLVWTELRVLLLSQDTAAPPSSNVESTGINNLSSVIDAAAEFTGEHRQLMLLTARKCPAIVFRAILILSIICGSESDRISACFRCKSSAPRNQRWCRSCCDPAPAACIY